MNLDIPFIFLCFLYASFAFLFDGRTQSSLSTKNVVATDQFNFLKDLIIEERQARTQLENQMGYLQNYTKSLEQQLQRIYNTQSSYHQFIISENKKLKQDIVTTQFERNKTAQRLEYNEFKTNDRILALESNISKTYTNVVQKLGAWSDRALFSAWPDTTTIHAGGEIPFTNIQVSNGIKDLSSIRNHGSFVCEKDGYYLVSCFIRTDTSSAKFRIERNNDIIAAGSKHGDTGFESHAAIAAVHLDVGDVLHVTAGNTMVVDSKFDSVFTVVQIM
ncbi:unnamed protein product [Mytilus edulis]|uniref:C1q domain-containing protein n=1 Tax=Mytilus edulis TaxID=6550 RepID=A0A8S3UX46_MYTED|nr:unnamed protein product [Mytilus edulis]